MYARELVDGVEDKVRDVRGLGELQDRVCILAGGGGGDREERVEAVGGLGEQTVGVDIEED
jgi:hypothetical protein